MSAIGGYMKTGGIRRQRSTLFAVDIVGFTAAWRDSEAQFFLRRTLYEAMNRAFDDAQLVWDTCYHQDRGDGMLIIIPPPLPSAPVIDSLVNHLRSALLRRNQLSHRAARIQLRVAVHCGEVQHDDHGLSGVALQHVFRLLDAPVLKQTLTRSREDIALIVSDHFRENVIQREPVLAPPGTFQAVTVAVKETRTRAWLHLAQEPTSVSWPQPGEVPRTPQPAVPAAGLHEADRHATEPLIPPFSDNDQELDAILEAAEAEELARIRGGLHLDAGLTAITQGRPDDCLPAADAEDSGEPLIIANTGNSPALLEILPFRWVRQG
jgi:hypothetical protein